MTAAMRKHFYTGKKSEYRQNYLPFDYYDFWITAKENENLRCRNKLRDYLHTPFDWDEDQEVYLENRPIGSVEVINHATQTTERPNRHDHLQIKANQKPQQVHQHQQQQQQPQQHHVQTQQAPSRPQSAQQINNRPKSTKKSKKSKKKVGINSVVAHVQPNVAPNPYAFGVDISRPRHARSNSAREYRHTPTFEELRGYKAPVKKLEQPKQSNNGPANKNITSIAIQTPLGWNLRDFKDQRPASTSKKPSRPVSAINIRATKAPFANYGWATKTPDMSIKPTHNALANKSLAKENNREAVLELTLQKLKKDASRLANEYSLIESRMAEKFLTGRSDSKSWHSEYDDRYPDYSKTALNKDIYFKEKPYRLTKSQLVLNYPPLKRGPRSASKKIYYN